MQAPHQVDQCKGLAWVTILAVSFAFSGQRCFATMDENDFVDVPVHIQVTPVKVGAPVNVDVIPLSEPKTTVVPVPNEEPLMAIPQKLAADVERPHVESAFGVLQNAIDSASKKLQVRGVVLPR